LLRLRSFLLMPVVLAFASVASAQTPVSTSSTDGATPAATATPPPAPTPAPVGQTSSTSTPTSPLAIHVGDADLLIGGFMDATSVTRSTTTGNGLGTSFGSIPFLTQSSSTANLPETRLSTQNSRLTLMGTSKAGSFAIKGYMEVDFLGNAPTNLVVTSNANTLRMRLYWVQATNSKFEFLAGQSWSMMTPGRNGISPAPGDIFFSQDVDTNYQSGLVWGRTTSYRLVAHPSKEVSAGVSFENPEQYVGSAVTLPAKFASAEVDNGSNSAASNRYPDIIGKIAFDPTTGKTHQHIEFSGLFRGFKTYDTTAFTTHTATGKGGSLNVNLEPVKNLHLVFNSFFSKGGGRYIANTNIPDFIVNADSSMTLVTSHSLMGGVEVQATPKTLIYGYYSDVKANQAIAFDLNGTTPIGFGITGATSANNEVQESTGGLTQTFFKDAKIGGMQLMAQFSYVKRTPFSVPTGTPATANSKMFFLNIRYILP
jgi:hypothetical protein